ncbi:winged helix-turn-helix domain-containing protein [Sphaerisporangium rubeum]|uniref:DNA-binding transcriptional ArsR family regulator n=1 Tax=Sphaerisporangium rubeum TaxID=321317 RepID=A0A7X0IE42_9ACTN|nr:winged helix-turn-helix domain-containing protein [Sphaerisporangium rubeum]MBB6473365.1 DNA-binding transcriptional ArsR family regulator [Sphaerisporangium rubeum]
MGTLRIHFTADDLARTTVAAAPDPLWEVVLSRFRLRETGPQPLFRPWLGQLRAHPARLARMRPGARLLDTLVPPGPYFPDFLTPSESEAGLEHGIEALLSTPRRRLRAELARLGRHHDLPAWARPLADGDTAVLTAVGHALRDYHEAAITPYHAVVHGAVAADRAQRAHDLLGGGVEGLLAGLRPLMRWVPPVLEVNYDVDRDLRLGGRGLRLVPSYFCQRVPISLADPVLPPVLIYPIERRHRFAPAAADPQGLAALLGRTRAAVLDALGDGATTTELARRLRTSPASISRHTGVLREAGLITTRRDGAAVLHSVSPLGTALLEGRLTAPLTG